MLLTCPICHGQLVSVFPIYLEDFSNPIGYYGYCPSLRCKVKKVVFGRDLRVVHVYKFKDLNQKKKAILDALRRNFRKYPIRVKGKLLPKYKKLWNELVK